MKIVSIIARLNVGGPARHVIWLTEALQDDEFQSTLTTGTVPAGEEDMSYFAAQHKVVPIFIPEMSRELSPKDVFSLWKVYQTIRREKPDIIHTHTAKAGTIGRVAGFLYRWLSWGTFVGKPRRVKLIHTYHGHVFHSYYSKLKTKIFLSIEKILACVATDKIIVISQQQFEEINGKFGIGKTQQFEIIPLGIDLSQFQDWQSKRSLLREEIGAEADEILVGIVGRLTEIKNLSLFLEVARICKQHAGVNLPKMRFVIIGDGNLRGKLETDAALLNIEDVVIFLGNRKDTDIFYSGLDIVALTSLNEGTPMSLIEAMANEKPIISTLVGGVVDLLGQVTEDKGEFQICERGLAVSSKSAEKFSKGLMYYAKDKKLQKRLGESGRRFVQAQHGNERLIDDIRNLYRTNSR